MEGEIGIMPQSEPLHSLADAARQFGQVVAKTVSFTLHAQARRSWYYSSTFSQGVDSDEVVELTHEVLMLLPNAIRNFRGEAKAETYVATIARNHVMRVLKKRANEAHRRLHMPAHLAGEDVSAESWLDSLGAANQSEPDFTETIAAEEADRQAVGAFAGMATRAGLTSEQAEVVRLRRSGFSDKEIAASMGCSQGTVRKRYFDAKEKLRQAYLADPRWKG